MENSGRARPVPLIGLIGPIGCGKSTVARILAGNGAAVIDADQSTREMMAPGMPLTEQILDHFGAQFRRADGSLDRAALGRLVFADPGRLAELEKLTHPAINAALGRLLAQAGASGPRAVVLEAIRLVEAGYAAECDEVWLVVCDPKTQLARLVGRGMTEADARQRMAAQTDSLPAWRAAATRVIDTDCSLSELESLIVRTFDEAVGPIE